MFHFVLSVFTALEERMHGHGLEGCRVGPGFVWGSVLPQSSIPALPPFTGLTDADTTVLLGEAKKREF